MNLGIKLADRSPVVTDAELAWLTFLRDLYGGKVRSPSLHAVQALRASLSAPRLGG